MISRIWHGYTTHENADAYERILRQEVMHEIEGKNIAGFKEIRLLRRELEDETEFITIIQFENMDSVRVFAGEDHEQAFVPEVAQRILKRYDKRVAHYEMRHEVKYL